jgi:hypothetical protein
MGVSSKKSFTGKIKSEKITKVSRLRDITKLIQINLRRRLFLLRMSPQVSAKQNSMQQLADARIEFCKVDTNTFSKLEA